MLQKDVFILIVVSSATFFLFGFILIIFYNLFQKRKIEFLQEIVKTKIEIKEQTLKNISWEIHDNIGQILSTMHFVNYSILENAPKELQSKVEESQKLLEKAITEVRALSKSLNTDYIKNVGFVDSIQLELARINRLKFLTAHFEIVGEQFRVSEDVEVVLLRIAQEFISNTLKHSKSKNLWINIQFNHPQITIDLRDDGVGMAKHELNGTGMLNMKNRAKLIGAKFQMESVPDFGTQLKLSYISKLTN